MLHNIKELAASAVALQNKGAMDAALREIGALAEQAIASGVGEVAYVGFGGNQVDKVWIDEAPQAGDAVQIAGAEVKPSASERTTELVEEFGVQTLGVNPAKKGAK